MAPTKTYIHQLNVVRFETLLQREPDGERSATLKRLLDEERTLLEAAIVRDGRAPAADSRR